jgi:hypothetical protein
MSDYFRKYVCSKGLVESFDIIVLSNEEYVNIIKNTKENSVVYIKTDYLKTLTSVINLINFDFILVSGSSDYTIPTDIFESYQEFLQLIENKKIIKFYSQNCIVEHHPKLVKIPIGLDYHTLSNYSNFWGEQKTPIEQEKELISICNNVKTFWERKHICYSNFHFIDYGNKFGYSRKDIINTVPKELVYYEPTKIKRIETWIKQTEYSFVISPFGNGLDCHRTWEALILGCIVVVKKSPLDCLYDELPVLIVNDWSDITESLLEKTVMDFKNKTFNYKKLTLEYYVSKIKSHSLQ